MKKSFRKIAINTFLSMAVFSSLLGVNAATITETTGNDEYDTIADNSIVIGITKFEPNEVVTSKKTIKAAGNFYRFKNSNKVDPTIYYYLGSWFELDEDNNATVVEDQEKLKELSIYYVNNVEKMIEIPYAADLAEGYNLVFETNDSEKDDEVKHQDGKLFIPATLKEIKVIAKNDETNNEIVLDTLENVEDEFVTSTTVVTTLAELKAAIANKDADIRLGADITEIGEVLTIPYTVNLNGNNHKLTFNELVKDEVTKVASGLVISGDNSVVNDLTIEMTEKAEWQGNYALQVYDATGVVLKNYAGTKADAALLINGATVELTGTTVVTGNEYGGIEVSRGTNPELENSRLVVT